MYLPAIQPNGVSIGNGRLLCLITSINKWTVYRQIYLPRHIRIEDRYICPNVWKLLTDIL